ncbi:tripartite tricarboxylate transporter substrate binding protein [Clostridium transplantifaecale]|uniref:tripartite tricarboxylate transporter substrate binding protein n=1 Tax=Clostridium transplantifaecale TaxID=2479838 RepID=UPI000F62FAB4|nr:tripartite tricarboxylate transporter substrate binding protein [Clostridium transplantifaecale]
MKKTIKAVMAVLMTSVIAMTGCGSAAQTDVNTEKKADGANAAADGSDLDWPKETITITVPYSAGGDTDTYCRQMSNMMSKKLGVNVVVVNTTGGAGVVAASSVMSAKNDGYNLLFHHTGVMLTQEAAGSNQFSFLDDFEVVGSIARDDTYALIAKAGSQWTTLEDMIAWAKANPGKLKYSITFNGATHAVAEQMERTMGIEMDKIDVGSSTADRLTAFMANQCDILVVNYMNIADYIENGDFVVLGVCSEERLKGLEDFPTLKEQGYDVVQPKVYEVRAPKGTDPAIVGKLSECMKEIAEAPEFQEILTKYYAEAFYRNGEDTIAEDRAEVEAMKELFAQ